MPSAWAITGMRLLPRTWWMNDDEPRAMIMSTRSSRRQQRVHLGALLQQHQRRAASSPCSASTWRASSASARLLCRASRPPFSTTALPLFQPSPVICTSASGRASNTTPSTPSGQVMRSSTRSLSSWRWVSAGPPARACAPAGAGHRHSWPACPRPAPAASPARGPAIPRASSSRASDMSWAFAASSALARGRMFQRRGQRLQQRPALRPGQRRQPARGQRALR